VIVKPRKMRRPWPSRAVEPLEEEEEEVIIM
jgi:hypothetical protein